MPYKDKNKIPEYHRRWYLKNRDESLRKHKIYYSEFRLKILIHYCIEFLSLDHINGGGTTHRKSIGTDEYIIGY